MADTETPATGVDPEILELASLLEPCWPALRAQARAAGLVCEGEDDDEAARRKKEEEERAERDDPDAELLRDARNPDAVRSALKAEREAAAAAKKEAEEARAKVKEYEDRDKTEQQKKEEAAAAATKRADDLEAKLLRYEVAAAKNIPLNQAHRLQGSSKEELENDADEFLKSLKTGGNGGGSDSGFDGGARSDAPAGSMDELIRRAAGRA